MYKRTSPMDLELKTPESWQENNERVSDDGPLKPKLQDSSSDLIKCDEKKETIGSLFRDFAQNTTAHGLGRVEAATSLFRRLLWIVIVLSGMVALCYMCSTVIIQFLSKPVGTSLTMSFKKNLQFPSVTVCNMNMLKLNKIQNKHEFKDLDKMMTGYNDAWFPHDDGNSTGNGTNSNNNGTNVNVNGTNVNSNVTNPANGTNSRKKRATNDDDEDVDQSTLSGWIAIDGDDADIANSEYNSDEMIKKQIEKMLTKYPKKRLVKAGHSMNDLIYKCSWMGFNCKKGPMLKYWNHFWNWKYGNCYVFNTGFTDNGTSMPVFTVGNSGPDYGLSMDFYIEQDQYIGLMSPEAGVRIVLADQGTMPFPYDQGFSISPGTSSSIGIRKLILGRADPFGNRTCHSDLSPTISTKYVNLFSDSFTSARNYTVHACIQNCIAEKELDICNCSESKFPRPINRSEDTQCRNKKQEKCLQDIYRRFDKDEFNCSKLCPQRCINSIFRHTISQSQWSNAYEDLMKRELVSNTDSRFKQAGGSSSELKQNFLRVNIFYEELNLEQIEQAEYYFLANLLGDIGGQLGLWVGISVITVAECCELVMNIFHLMFRKFLRR